MLDLYVGDKVREGDAKCRRLKTVVVETIDTEFVRITSTSEDVEAISVGAYARVDLAISGI